MLWMKGWLETRWRFVLMLGLALVTLFMGERGDGIQTVEHARNFAGLQWMVSIIAAIQLAGAGIRTQSPFRAKAGLHGSTQYTLSMPVMPHQYRGYESYNRSGTFNSRTRMKPPEKPMESLMRTLSSRKAHR